MSNFEIIRKNGLLFDSVLEEMKLLPDNKGGLKLELMIKSRQKRFLISLIDVKQFEFSYYDDYVFYNFENTKLFRLGELYYFSFDPSETEGVSDEDKDVITCSEILLNEL